MANENLSETNVCFTQVERHASEYHCYDSCNKCGGTNELINPIYEECGIVETRTKCKDCKFDDYWAYGYFESSRYIECRCKTYNYKDKS